MNNILFVWSKTDDEQARDFALEKICLECPEKVIEIMARNGLLEKKGDKHGWIGSY